jgi:uncharacterized protein (TIGR00255 family)
MAALSSMTGYARASGSVPGIAFTCEVKSVNSRGLDLRMRLPPGNDGLEPELRRRIGKAVTRGAIGMTLTIDREGAGGDVVVNKQALTTVLEAVQALGDLGLGAATIDGILGLKGVLDQHEKPLAPEAEEALQAAIYGCADEALRDLAVARRDEGKALTAILLERIDEIAALTKAAELHPGRGRDAILEKLRRQVEELVAVSPALSEERLNAEAMLLATKADIREELDRLTAHIAAARALIAEGGPVGRQLDFLSQEFNREANTLCSKSNSVELTAIGLDLKAVIDQFREQVQNVE